MEVKPTMPMVTSHPKDTSPYNGGLSRLVTAAVINRKFRDLLLTNPTTALASGYSGESFDLTPEERNLVLSIRASSLTDFAVQLTRNVHDENSRRFVVRIESDTLR
jgi:hypothetical protein